MSPPGKNPLLWPAPAGLLPEHSAVEASQLYYTSWGPASLARSAWTDTGRMGEDGDWHWHWEHASLYHFTKPPWGGARVGSRRGGQMLEVYGSGLDLAPVEPALRRYASFAGGAYDLNASSRPAVGVFEYAEATPLPEPPPLALLVTGLACIFLARGLRRRRAP